jgi:Tol biopolymer transport system component
MDVTRLALRVATRNRLRQPLITALGAVGCSVALIASFPVTAATTELISVVADGSRGAGGSDLSITGPTTARSVSNDGRYVVFASSADTFGPRDGNKKSDVYLRDRKLDRTERISAPGAVWVNGFSDRPTITPDGRYVAFQSAATTLVPGDTNGSLDVFVRDRQTGVVERVSVASNGEQGNSGSEAPSISSDGRYVAFHSNSTNFAPGTSPSIRQIYVRDRLAGTTTLVSVNAAGQMGNDESVNPSISGDGQRIAFESGATNLAPGADFGFLNIYVRDRQAGTTVRASITPTGDGGNSSSSEPALSLDGRFVAFRTEATDLTEDLSGLGDIVVRDLQASTTERITVAAGGGSIDGQQTGTPAISRDGRYVAFYTDASNPIGSDTNGQRDVYLRDRQAKTTQRVSVAAGGAQSSGPSGGLLSISGNGRVVAFDSSSTDLVANDADPNVDVYVRVLTPGTPALAITPQSMTFLNIEVGRTQSDVFFFTNNGGATIDFARIGIRGTDRTQFLPTNNCGHSIAPGVTCNYVITFKPASPGLKQARLRVELTNGTVIWRNIQGTGVNP